MTCIIFVFPAHIDIDIDGRGRGLSPFDAFFSLPVKRWSRETVSQRPSSAGSAASALNIHGRRLVRLQDHGSLGRHNIRHKAKRRTIVDGAYFQLKINQQRPEVLVGFVLPMSKRIVAQKQFGASLEPNRPLR